MSKIHFVFALSSVLLGGCYIQATETDGGTNGTGGSCSGSCKCKTSDAAACAKDADCDTGSYCDTSAGSCVESNACKAQADCASGFACDTTRSTCVPAPSPKTCADLGDEASGSARNDCLVVYAGVNCSCGPDCACKGGEPGCVCQSFEFFKCEAVSP